MIVPVSGSPDKGGSTIPRLIAAKREIIPPNYRNPQNFLLLMCMPPHALLLPLCTTWIICVEICPPALHDTLSPFIAVSALKLNVVANTGGLIEINSAENMNSDACKDLLAPIGSRLSANTDPEMRTPL